MKKNSNLYKAAYARICVDEEMKSNLKEIRKSNISYSRAVKVAGIAAATICLLFTGLVNGSASFAAGVENMPVIGTFAKLVHFRSYSEETEDYAISVSIPAVIETGEKNSERSDAINAEIMRRCEQYASEAKERALEYRKIFLETGGTEEEWKEHDITITVDYEIKNNSDDYLSFVIYGYESWLSSEAVAYYYNLNVATMQSVTLEELLGNNYVDFVNAQINQKMKERQENKSDVFFTQEEGGFHTISEDQKFYINSAGNVVIVFDKYEIAPGSMGNVEFEIVVF